MRATQITVNLPVTDLESARGFYTGYLGLRDEEFSLGWVARYTSPDTGASLQLVSRDASAPDVDAAYAEAQARGYEIVYPLTDEPWGVRRFFVRAPDGNALNIVRHRD
jgi:catechol 2,3-dioxygenase-like lactoylglutathione lyase family enzyme